MRRIKEGNVAKISVTVHQGLNMSKNPKKDIKDIFYAGLRVVDAYRLVKKSVIRKGDILLVGKRKYNLRKFDSIYIVGGGKACASMGQALEELLYDKITGGIIIVKYGHLTKTNPVRKKDSCGVKKVELVEAGHPIPDRNGLNGAKKILKLLEGLGEKSLVLCVISGGGSALMTAPVKGITLKNKQDTTQLLLNCGADINQINKIRKHLSLIKGGRLAQAAYPATLATLMLSDVVGDNPDTIASGPTVPESSTFRDCIEIINHFNLTKKLPSPVLEYLKRGTKGKEKETPKPGSYIFNNTYNFIIGNNIQAILQAKKKAKELGYNTFILSSMVEGETKDVAKVHTAIAKEILASGNPVKPPACIISGGETTVTIRGKGKGGRNQEFALACSIEIDGFKRITILSAGTDGTDGPTQVAGAFADGKTCKKARDKGINPLNYLKNNDSYNFFEAVGGLFLTGPTNANVMDLRIIVVR